MLERIKLGRISELKSSACIQEVRSSKLTTLGYHYTDFNNFDRNVEESKQSDVALFSH